MPVWPVCSGCTGILCALRRCYRKIRGLHIRKSYILVKKSDSEKSRSILKWCQNQIRIPDLFDLHIMEFKKSINTATLDKSKWQLAMGLYNARAVAGFLGIHIRNIRFYSGYRRDEIIDMDQAALIQLRASNHGEAVKKMNDWKKGICRLQVDGKSCNYQQDKIRLDDNGYGTVILS